MLFVSMKSFVLLSRIVAFITPFVFIVSGCSEKTKKVPRRVESADFLYKKGFENIKKGRFNEAVKNFEVINQNHPYSRQARKAILLEAFANYREGKYDKSIELAKQYMELYPSDKEADSAQYIIGLSYFQQIRDISRDQEPARLVVTTMEELIERWPNSSYVSDARQKIRFGRNQLAAKEMEVGRYYLERREYISAIQRFRYVVENYPTTPHMQEALFRLQESCYAIGLGFEAHSYGLLLQKKYPQSDWLKASKKRFPNSFSR